MNEVSANVKSRLPGGVLASGSLGRTELHAGCDDVGCDGIAVRCDAVAVRPDVCISGGAGAKAGGTPAHPRRTASRNWNKTFVFAGAVWVLLTVTFSTGFFQGSSAADSTAGKGKSQRKERASCCNHVQTADASSVTAAPTRKAVLEPSTFGMATFGYSAAKACPEVVEKLFCYCGCDLTDKHSSLLDCFTSTHGLDCHICQEEAILALKLHKDGLSVADIQKTIDEKYTHDYPFQEDTEAYKKYKASRLYGKDATNTEVAGPSPSDDAPAAAAPKLKPGKKVGKCCSAGNHKDKKE